MKLTVEWLASYGSNDRLMSTLVPLGTVTLTLHSPVPVTETQPNPAITMSLFDFFQLSFFSVNSKVSNGPKACTLSGELGGLISVPECLCRNSTALRESVGCSLISFEMKNVKKNGFPYININININMHIFWSRVIESFRRKGPVIAQF